MTYDEERRGLHHSIEHSVEKPFALLRVGADEGATIVLDRVRSVTLAVVEGNERGLRTVDEWRSILPAWFIERFAPELSQAEAEEELARWQAMTDSQRHAHEGSAPWTFTNWLYWVETDNRSWRFGGVDSSGNEFTLQAIADEWPVPLGALEWIVRASGGRLIDTNWK